MAFKSTRLGGIILNSTISSLLLVLLPILSTAQQKPVSYTIHLKQATLAPEANAKQWLKNTATARTTPSMVLLQFDYLPTSEQKEQLKAKGITLLNYVNGNAYTAIVSTGRGIEEASRYSLRSIIDIKPEWKAEESFWKKIGQLNDEDVELLVTYYKGLSGADILTHVSSIGGTIMYSDLEKVHRYQVNIPARKVKELAAWYGVTYVGLKAAYEPLDVEGDAAAGAAIIKAPTSVGGLALKGDGITIGVGDNVAGIYHIDLVDRIINYNPQGYTNHGQHINGIVGGAGIIDPKAEGVVPHATLVDHLYDNVLPNTGAMRQAHNMNITNNSYATIVGDTAFAGTYDQYAQALDELALEYTDVLHVFASGNDGYMSRPPYPMTFGTVCGGYQPAKNNIVVTNNSKKLENRWEASKGPVKDGRLKPEVSAIGNEIISTKGGDIYLVSGGTSMAAPQFSGLAGLLTQRYKQLFGNTNPRSDLLKVLLLNGSFDQGNAGPDYAFGFGMVDIERSVEMLDSGRYFIGNPINNGGQQTFTINIPANIAKLKVMLCYHDKPASLLAPMQLINDLDIEVVEPNNTVHYPLILNSNRPDVLTLAAEGRDSLNNSEQVTINNPVAGTYTIRIKGYNVPEGPQPFVVSYDYDPIGLHFKNPITGTSVSTNDSLCVYWNASDNANPLTLEYTTNNGANWTVIDNNIPAGQKHYIWFVPNVSSEQCMLRLTRNTTAQQIVSGTFVINPIPVVTIDSSALCPGYIKINWSPVPNATGYTVMRKLGYYMQPIATITDTTYTFSGLSLDSMYYIAVQPLINGVPGYRSIAVMRKPNNGNCAGNISDNDLMIERIISPGSGRLFTNTQLTNNTTLVVKVRNLDDATSGSYTIHYEVNNVWQTYTGSGLPANTSTDISIPGLNLSAAGTYTIKVAIQNTSSIDGVVANDSATKVVRQLNNNVVNVVTPFLDGFEGNAPTDVLRDSMGITQNEHWDFVTSIPDSGRVRTYVNDSFIISGSRSITMDVQRNMPSGAQNYLTGTFNLSNIDTASEEVRMDFDYMIHGRPKFYDGNGVWVRGDDTQPWISLYHYDTALQVAQVVSSGSLSITQALRSAGQNYSTSTQIRFGQNDTSLVASRDYGNGMTLDNFRLYTLQKDMQMLSILSPVKSGCGLNGNMPVTIRVYNSVSQVQNNVQVNYSFDNGPVVSDMIASIAGYDTLDHTFQQAISNLAPGMHTISVWLSAPGDDYPANDSIMKVTVYNQPLITAFPFLEDFENGDGYWYHEGANDSWEYGMPNGNRITNAASGSKAWITNLDGDYNNMELSYLYTTCFDISSLTNPKLSFKLITDIENCGATLCDAAYLQYSYDNISWTKLGNAGEGTNWYDTAFNVWNRQDSIMWREATISLPNSNQPIRFRYIFASDQGATREGIGVDDFRIYGDTAVIEEPFEGMVIFPNPTNLGYLTVKWSAEPGTTMQAVITDIAGRVVFKGTTTATEKVNKTNLSTGRYMTGIYFVKLIIGDREYIEKVLFTQ